jgi:hypothetical protein
MQMKENQMTQKPRHIEFDDFVRQVQSIFDMLAHEKRPVMVERQGQLFRLEREPGKQADIWAGYSPDHARQAVRESAGALRGVNRKQLLRDLREQREQDSHGRPA